jgi:hypothetical protein
MKLPKNDKLFVKRLKLSNSGELLLFNGDKVRLGHSSGFNAMRWHILYAMACDYLI